MKKYFNSNEKLELCDVSVTQQGQISVETKIYNREAMERLGRPEKTIRGRVTIEDGIIKFAPYAESSRKPTYSNQVVVGSTTIAVTAEKVKLSLVISRNYSKDMLARLIESELREVLRRIKADVYDAVIASPKPSPTEGVAEKGGTL